MKWRLLSSKFIYSLCMYDVLLWCFTYCIWMCIYIFQELNNLTINRYLYPNDETILFLGKQCTLYMYFTKISIYIRENSIEYNQPTLQPAKAETRLTTCLCCGHSPTTLIVRDQISTIYFDDILMDSVRNDTRKFNTLHTFCCGGRGEEVRLESRFCWDACYRGRSLGSENCGLLNSCCCCIPCVPVGCPDCLCPCAARVSFFIFVVFFVLLVRA